jgi:cytochrome P450
MPKHTPTADQMLLGKYLIPKDTTLVYDAINVQRNPKYWGADVDAFNPSRFDGRNGKQEAQTDTGDDAPGANNEKIKMPVRGAFVPFSEGPRSCLGTLHGKTADAGRKFAQVELVACLVVIVREWQIELADGWTKERVWDIVNQSASIITLAPKENIPLVYRRRTPSYTR